MLLEIIIIIQASLMSYFKSNSFTWGKTDRFVVTQLNFNSSRFPNVFMFRIVSLISRGCDIIHNIIQIVKRWLLKVRMIAKSEKILATPVNNLNANDKNVVRLLTTFSQILHFLCRSLKSQKTLW